MALQVPALQQAQSKACQNLLGAEGAVALNMREPKRACGPHWPQAHTEGGITMYYIVRVYGNGTYDREFWTLDAAADFMAGLDAYCELYLWRAGREEYMGSNRER